MRTRQPRARVRLSSTIVRGLSPANYVTSTELVLWLSPYSWAVEGDALIWRDLGPYANNFVSARDAPTTDATAIDGNAGLAFDGTLKQVLRCGCFTGLPKGSKPCAFIIAGINADHPAGTPTLLYLAGKNSLLQAAHILFDMNVGASTGAHAKARHGAGGTLSDAGIGGSQWANGTQRLFMGVAANASDRAEIWVDNTLRGTASAGAADGLHATPTHAVIGSGDEGGGATRWMDGPYYEAFMFAGKPTTAEISALIDGYIAAIWPTLHATLA